MSDRGGFEVFYTYTVVDNQVIELRTNVLAKAAFSNADVSMGAVKVRFGTVGAGYANTFVEINTLIGSVIVDRSDYEIGSHSIDHLVVRVFMYDSYLSVYCNDVWVYSYAFEEVSYPDPTTKSVYCISGSAELVGIRSVELFDSREAVWIDYEATSESAIQSVIQQRPIQIYSEPDRSLAFTYDGVKDDVVPVYMRRYTETIEDGSALSSDGLVYYEDVGISVSLETAKEVGLVTRLYRLSELSTGAVSAAAKAQKLALERRVGVTIQGRLDPRLQIGDRLLVSVYLTSTNRHIQRNVVIEDISISTENGEQSMNISGRRSIDV